MKEGLSIIFVTLGVLLLVLPQVTGIGVFLYQWDVEDLSLGLAAWTGFKWWIGMMVAGLISSLIILGSMD